MNGRRKPPEPDEPGRPEREVPLVGGIANRGQVVRIGDTVRRPQRSWSVATHALLLHLEAVGFDGAPRFLGVDSQGREVLSYIPGTTVLEPYPNWALEDEALVSAAELLRAYHDAASTFDPLPYPWAPPPPVEFAGNIVTHNDMKIDNVVFRGARAVGLIDFDLAGTGSRAWDVACAARLWAPLRPGVHISDKRRHRKFERFRLLVDSYGMNDSDRMKVVEGVEQNYVWFYNLIKTQAASAHAAFSELWSTKTEPRAELTRRWHSENKANLRTALGIPPLA
jgi:Phosphotransferase enzyme family